MKENKNVNTVALKYYEPVKVEVVKAAPQGVLCQSHDGAIASMTRQSVTAW